jgi:hypothetical protein
MRKEFRSSNLLFYCPFYFLLCSGSVGRRVSRSRSKSDSSNGRSRAVLRRGLSVLCPIRGLEHCGVGAPLRYRFTPTIRLDGRQLRDTARHASTRRKIVRHACKLLSPWPIKGRAIPQPQGGRRTVITRTLSSFTTILALASINTSRTWRPGLLSRHACSPPLRAPRCNTI